MPAGKVALALYTISVAAGHGFRLCLRPDCLSHDRRKKRLSESLMTLSN